MLSVEAWTTIRYVHAQGKPLRAIAKELGIARNTVRAALRCERPPRYTRPPRPNPQLTPFADDIRRMALEQQLIGTRILRKLRARGYTGGLTALYRYLRTLRAAAAPPAAVERFETPPAHQGQFDWSPYTVALGEQPTPIVVFALTLGYSRRSFYWPSRDQTQASVFEALEAAFQHFGGVPKTLLVDNAKVFVSDARPDRFAWNPRRLSLCGHYALEPVACHPYRPQTKGKVERPFSYLEEHFIKGRTWPRFAVLHQELVAFVADELDVRIHATTREPPAVRFQQERGLLTPLPTTPFLSTQEPTRSVSRDCLVAFGGSRYSVPWPYAGQRVWVRLSQGVRLTVRTAAGEVIARHDLAPTKGMTIIDPAHYAGLRGHEPVTRAVVIRAFLERFPEAAAFVDGVLAQHPPNGVAHLRAVLRLADLYPAGMLRAAFAAAHTYRSYSHAFIRGIVEAGGARPTVGDASAPALPQGGAARRPALTADLAVYQAILEGQR
jgi:transposase